MSEASGGAGNHRDEDALEYKRWKTWAQNRILTLGDKVAKEARGAFIFTLLQGKALECVEHLEPSTYQCTDGDKVLFGLLDKRFPQKDVADELGETLQQVVSIRAADGENLKTWISRATELFDRCRRKTNAVVLARSLGVLKIDEISRAMRSCYPDFVAKNKSHGVSLVEDPEESFDLEDQPNNDFEDIEAFLADHEPQEGEPESFLEDEVAEILAVRQDEDALEYKRWKTWAQNRILTLGDKVAKEARGAFIFTLLQGKALECVEHLEPSTYQCTDGDKVLFGLLDKRFPQKDVADELGETLQQVFSIRAADGENLKTWISRATELFDRCRRKTNVDFPSEARGWIVLHRSGLNSEQKAVVLARSLGVLKIDEISRAMRSCYPDFVAKNKSHGVSLVEDPEESFDLEDQPNNDFEDIEAFLADHEPQEGEPESFLEDEVAEILAVSWKDKRKEITKLQQQRRFGEAKEARRRFRVEIEELKRKTRCRKCNQVGHWEKECTAKGRGKSSFKSASSSKPASSESGAGLVQWEEHFVASVECLSAGVSSPMTMVEQLRQKHRLDKPVETLLVSSPGYGVLDSGCGKSIIGAQTLADFRDLWSKAGISQPDCFPEINHFRYGNDQQETSVQSIKIPVKLAGKTGSIKAAVVKGRTPLLISRATLRQLKAHIDFGRDELRVFDQVLPLETNQAGQYVVSLLGESRSDEAVAFEEVLNAEPCSSPCEVVDAPEIKQDQAGSTCPIVSEDLNQENEPTSLVWTREDWHLSDTPGVGHPPNCDLIRILKNGQASDRAIALARQHSCDFCQSQKQPKVPLPASTHRCTEFNQQVGLDVVYLPGWKPNQKIKALNLLDQASCFQQVLPFFESETSQLLRDLYSNNWKRWAGPPKEMVLDPAQTNLGDPLQAPVELDGTVVKTIAAEAHWQLGRTERHGGWFRKVLQKVIEQHSPRNREEWLECVQHSHVKNQMIQSYGLTPHQFVFGRNPEIPGDLLNEPLHIVPATAGLTDQAIARTQALRSSARQAVLALQDDQSLRRALLARPRVSAEFKPGELVCYWRQQKYQQGQINQQARWYGTAVVIGNVGRNVVIAHRKNIFRCAPEQLRPATNEERCLIETPEAELLGVKDLIEGGTFRSKQFVDLVPEHYPTLAPAAADSPIPSADSETIGGNSEEGSQAMVISAEMPPPEVSLDGSVPEPVVTSSSTSSDNPDASAPSSSNTTSSYGPIRRRIHEKNGPMALWRPAPMQQEDLAEVLREVVPQMIDDATSRLGHSQKRTLEIEPNNEEPPSTRPRREDEVLYIEEVDEIINDLFENDTSIEVLLASNVYGQNDAPVAWYKTFDASAIEIGWTRSKFDPCLYYLRSDDGKSLVGIMGVHVDDTAIGGKGPKFEAAVQALRSRFPYRKWRVREGEFCGAYYKQHSDFSINMSQKAFAESLKPAHIAKGIRCDAELTEAQIRVLRAINGSLNWLSSQSRPDLAVQTSLSQQAFPKPKIHNLRDANNAVRRARQNKDLEISFKPIPIDNLTICCHSDAAWANVGTHTQAGYVLAFVDKALQEGEETFWTPFTWRSYKLPRAASSTLSAESQSMATATGTVEWMTLLLLEAIDGPFEPRNARELLQKRPPILAIDCKSLFDHLISPSSPTSIEDRRTSIDVVIIRESLKLTGGHVRWLPTDRMLADAFTKDKSDPADLLRSCIKACRYQISEENTVLARQAEERKERLERRQQGPKAESQGVPVELPPSVVSELEEEEFEQVSCPGYPRVASRVDTTFPPGIESLKQWGNCVIAFGQYAKMNISYDEMLADPTKRSYVQWLKDHHGSRASAEYTDFVKYIAASDVNGESVEAYFPGTRTLRRFKQ
eukprot:symbB.v1.2.006585.t1/scaffold387.1/size215482/8